MSIEASSEDPDQTAPTGAVWSGFDCLLNIFQQTTKPYDFLWSCALRVNKCGFSVYTVTIFMKYAHVCALKQLIISLTKL